VHATFQYLPFEVQFQLTSLVASRPYQDPYIFGDLPEPGYQRSQGPTKTPLTCQSSPHRFQESTRRTVTASSCFCCSPLQHTPHNPLTSDLIHITTAIEDRSGCQFNSDSSRVGPYSRLCASASLKKSRPIITALGLAQPWE
jgi:hypothetical protein